MSSRRRLIALNAALLGVLGLVALSPAARAQRAGAQRTPGTYTMVSGRITGATSHAIYVVDSTNQEMVTLLWNQSAHGLDVIGYRDITADTQAVTGR
jgi:hypothetical protein